MTRGLGISLVPVLLCWGCVAPQTPDTADAGGSEGTPPITDTGGSPTSSTTAGPASAGTAVSDSGTGGGEATTAEATTLATSSPTTSSDPDDTGSTPSDDDTGTPLDPNPLDDQEIVVELVQDGFGFVEGPLWLADEGVLLFTDIPVDTILEYTPSEGVDSITPREQTAGMAANGLNLDENGNLIVCEQGNRAVMRRPPGTPAVVANAFMGGTFNSPNDVVVHANGTVYFTDPSFGGTPGTIGFQGIYRVAPGGEVSLVDNTTTQPNGILLSPERDRLYVDHTQSGNVMSYPLDEMGVPGAGTLLADVGGGADGMAIDVLGNLYVTSSDGVVVLAPDGEPWGTIVVPEAPANCAFGDDDLRTLYITARTGLYSVRLGLPGLPPPNVR